VFILNLVYIELGEGPFSLAIVHPDLHATFVAHISASSLAYSAHERISFAGYADVRMKC